MIPTETLRDIVIQQKAAASLPEGNVRRDLLDKMLKLLPDPRVLILTGLRRSGKSTLLRQAFLGRKDYCYVSFEDERFAGFKSSEFEQLNGVLLEEYPDARTYFFDEIQNVEGFESFVRRLQDQGKKIVVTGSNASLLSSEFGTRLTGRYKALEVWPFSFVEYLRWKGIVPGKDWPHLSEKKALLARSFRDYLLEGGLPEYLRNRDADYVRTLYENILYRDIITRYAIRRQRVIKEMVNLLASSVSSRFTYNALKNGLGLANALTVKEYVSYLQNAYLFFELPAFDFSLRRQLRSPKKVYLVDPAFHRIAGQRFSDDRGRLLENAVFIELRRRGSELSYHAGKRECDFLVKEGSRVTYAVQVCSSLERDNEQREVEGLLEAMERFRLRSGLLLTLDQDETRSVGKRKIQIMPAWKWMLSA